MINGCAAKALAGAVGTFFSAGTMERGMKMSYSIRLAIGIALLYNDLQNKEEFVFSVDAPPVFKKSGLRIFFRLGKPSAFGGGAAKRTRRGRLPRRNEMKPGETP